MSKLVVEVRGDAPVYAVATGPKGSKVTRLDPKDRGSFAVEKGVSVTFLAELPKSEDPKAEG